MLYQIVNRGCEAIDHPYTNLRDAVLAAASYDGYGAVFQRDKNGTMRLYSSARHLGNNPYFPVDKDAFSSVSDLADDAEAEADVARQVYEGGILHYRYDLDIIEIDN